MKRILFRRMRSSYPLVHHGSGILILFLKEFSYGRRPYS